MEAVLRRNFHINHFYWKIAFLPKKRPPNFASKRFFYNLAYKSSMALLISPTTQNIDTYYLGFPSDVAIVY